MGLKNDMLSIIKTHFILKRYKEGGIVYEGEKVDGRQVIEF